MIKELTPTPASAERGKEVERRVRPDQLPITQHVESFLKGLPEPEIASIERAIGQMVELDYVRMNRKWDSVIAAVFFAERRAHREHGLGLEPAALVGEKHRETRWGKLMVTQIGMDIADGNMKVTIRPLLASDSGSNAALQAGMRASALYLKGVYGWPAIPEYTVVGAGVSADDTPGHDPRIKETRRQEIEASKPPKPEKK